MKREAKIALAIAVPVTVIGAAYVIHKTLAMATKILMISVGEGGTTDPAPGEYRKGVGETVTIKAIPSEGYTVGTWVVDGVEVAREVASISVTMDVDHTVIVTFWKGGVVPPTYPVALQSLGSITVKQPVKHWWTGIVSIFCCHVAHSDESWNPNKLIQKPIRFKAVDAAGRGVPNVDVALWTDSMPDPSKYKGIMRLNGGVHTANNPLILKTDSEGVVSANVSYEYGLNDQFHQLCKDAGVGFQFGCGILPCTQWLPAKDGYCLPPTCYLCWVTGDCETEKAGCEAMGRWQLNRVTAQVVGTVLQAMEYVYCGFHVKSF